MSSGVVLSRVDVMSMVDGWRGSWKAVHVHMYCLLFSLSLSLSVGGGGGEVEEERGGWQVESAQADDRFFLGPLGLRHKVHHEYPHVYAKS